MERIIKERTSSARKKFVKDEKNKLLDAIELAKFQSTFIKAIEVEID